MEDECCNDSACCKNPVKLSPEMESLKNTDFAEFQRKMKETGWEVTRPNSITDEAVKDAIESVEYMTIGKKTTLCLITLKNGFEVVGTSACVDPANYEQKIGEPYALSKAVDLVWTHLASILQAELAAKDFNNLHPAA